MSGNLPRAFFPNDKFPMVFSQMETSQLCNLQRPKSLINLTLGKLYNREIAQYENCHLGSRPWENSFGKMPNTI